MYSIRAINSGMYCNQLGKSNVVINPKRPAHATSKGTAFHHGSTQLFAVFGRGY